MNDGARDSARRFDKNLAQNGGRVAYRVEEPVPACWFCNRTDRQKSKEHIFPQWLLDHLDIRHTTISPVRYTGRGELASQRGSFPLANLVCGEICRTCNNGWMSGLEGQVKTVLTRDTSDGPVAADELRLLAWWFIKTAIVLNVSQPYRLLVDAPTRHAVASGDLSRFSVALFRVSEDDQDVNWVQGITPAFLVPTGLPTDTTVRLSELTLAIHIRIGDLVGQVIDLPQPLDPSMVDADENTLAIWPDRPNKADWSDLPINDSILSALAMVDATTVPVDDLNRSSMTTGTQLSNTTAAADGSREQVAHQSVAITADHRVFLDFYMTQIVPSERRWPVEEIAAALDMPLDKTSSLTHDATDIGMSDSNCCQPGVPILVW